MKIFINFANENRKKQQDFSLRMAKFFGNFDKLIAYSPEDLSAEFVEKNKRILSEPRGAGLWLWKPYLILETLKKADEGDYIFYLDSGFFITKKIDLLIKALDKSEQDIMSFQIYYPEEQWTKKSLFERMGCVDEKYFKTNQFVGGICLIKNSDFSRRFFAEFLEIASVYENICDADSTELQTAKFIEHRHDQSIFSLLCKKYDLKPFRTPFVFGELGAAYAVMKKTSLVYKKEPTFNFINFNNSEYPTMLQVNRPFRFLGLQLDLFFVSYIYLKLLNIAPFKSWFYNFLLRMGTRSV